jgi:hypothetical protein
MNAKSNVVPLRQKAERESEKKWGRAVMDLGYSMIPSLIFRAQARLGLSPTQLVVLLHLADYWWHRAQMPFPSKAALAERMGLSDRQIQRYLTELENGGFIERVERFAGHKGQQSNEYNMSGLGVYAQSPGNLDILLNQRFTVKRCFPARLQHQWGRVCREMRSVPGSGYVATPRAIFS